MTSIGPEDVIFFASPKPNAGRLRFLLTFIARSARVPIGFENFAGIPVLDDGDLSPIPFSARTAGLIQRIIITRVPVLIGAGIPLFGSPPRDIALEHVATRQYASGLVQSEYVVTRS